MMLLLLRSRTPLLRTINQLRWLMQHMWLMLLKLLLRSTQLNSTMHVWLLRLMLQLLMVLVLSLSMMMMLWLHLLNTSSNHWCMLIHMLLWGMLLV